MRAALEVRSVQASHRKGALEAHRNARLTVHGRRLIVSRVLEEGWSPVACAEAAGVSRATVYKWLRRFREEGDAGLVDRSSRPHRSPRRLDPTVEHKILLARRRRRWGPHRLSYYLGVPRSTAYKVLVRHGCSRLSDFDRPTATRIRYVKDRPGQLVHIDVKQLGRIPDGGGWRAHGRSGHHASNQGYARIFTSNQACVDALPRWVRYYNTRRRHTALDGHTPHETVNNVWGKNS